MLAEVNWAESQAEGMAHAKTPGTVADCDVVNVGAGMGALHCKEAEHPGCFTFTPAVKTKNWALRRGIWASVWKGER